jgi:hypothetical protein
LIVLKPPPYLPYASFVTTKSALCGIRNHGTRQTTFHPWAGVASDAPLPWFGPDPIPTIAKRQECFINDAVIPFNRVESVDTHAAYHRQLWLFGVWDTDL